LRNGVSKSPYHTFPPGKGIGERISREMITEWERMSMQKALSWNSAIRMTGEGDRRNF
jgi:hypothetical protein